MAQCVRLPFSSSTAKITCWCFNQLTITANNSLKMKMLCYLITFLHGDTAPRSANRIMFPGLWRGLQWGELKSALFYPHAVLPPPAYCAEIQPQEHGIFPKQGPYHGPQMTCLCGRPQHRRLGSEGTKPELSEQCNLVLLFHAWQTGLQTSHSSCIPAKLWEICDRSDYNRIDGFLAHRMQWLTLKRCSKK